MDLICAPQPMSAKAGWPVQALFAYHGEAGGTAASHRKAPHDTPA